MGLRILVVEDATFIRDMIKKQLRNSIPGATIVDAPDGARALAIIKEQEIDLILSDWEMPQMTGAELLTFVRTTPETQALPFIMISSRGDRDHIIKAIELGVSDYLSKPFTADELVKKVFKQLKAIGKIPSHAPTATTQGIAHSSIAVLTGARPAATPSKKQFSTSAHKKESTNTEKGKAQFRFPNNRVHECHIREMSLQHVCGFSERTDNLPALFEQAVVDIENNNGEDIARVNGYVYAIQAGENQPDTQIVKITIRFVDNDADKFEALSKYIAKL